ncbi:MAG TPA: peptidyl-prolyl cis-trans isomerase [Candidatus Udaeobacter sp.]|nr:peptidyl-prolyl cis-trans isomerase [Candidatus Udaeobacter sp.]
MMKLLRKHRDWLMIVIAILAIPFIFYFVRTPDYGQMRSDRFARIYDRNVSLLEAKQMVRLLTLGQALGMSDFVQTLTAGAGQDPNQIAVQFILNLLVLRHEADRLGIRPDYSEIADVVRTLPAFQGDSGFDMKKFTDFEQNALSPMGLAEEHVEQLVRDQLSLNRIKQLLAAGVTVPKGELDENFQRGHDTLFVTMIRFQSADFDKDIKVSDEDVQKHYDAHKAELKTDEKRKVEFVSLALTDEEKKLTGKERIEALQKLSDRATDFTQALLEKGADFKQAAEKSKLPVHETGEFTEAEPDPQLKVDPALGAAAFKLSAQEANSDPIQVADGFYILHLGGITEARPLTLEEAKPKIVDTIKKSKAHELMSTKGAEVVQQLREAKQSGQPLEAAIQKAGGKAEKVPPFSLIEEEKSKSQDKEPKKNEPADLPAIKQAVAFLNPGETSDFFPAGESGFVAILEKREPLADANASEKKAAFEKRLLDNKRRVVLLEWLRDRGQAAGLQFTKG